MREGVIVAELIEVGRYDYHVFRYDDGSIRVTSRTHESSGESDGRSFFLGGGLKSEWGTLGGLGRVRVEYFARPEMLDDEDPRVRSIEQVDWHGRLDGLVIAWLRDGTVDQAKSGYFRAGRRVSPSLVMSVWPDDGAIDRLAESESPEERAYGASLSADMLACGRGSVATLIALADDENVDVARTAALGMTMCPRALVGWEARIGEMARLRVMRSQPSWDLLVQALGAIGSAEAVLALQSLEPAPGWPIQREVIRALGQATSGSAEAELKLIQILESERRHERVAVLDALSELGVCSSQGYLAISARLVEVLDQGLVDREECTEAEGLVKVLGYAIRGFRVSCGDRVVDPARPDGSRSRS